MTAQAQIEITASTSKLAQGLNYARARFVDFAGAAQRVMGKAFEKMEVGKTLKHGLGNFAGDMMTRGLDSLIDAGNGVRDFERNLVRLQIASGKTPEQVRAIGNSMRAISKDTGIASSEIQAGANAYIALTGDVDGATGAMSSFARIAQASGASVDDVAGATAALKQAMKLDVAKDTEAAFSALIVQGKAGAVEIKDMAGQLAELAPQFAQFKGASGLEGIREMGAAFQIVRKGAGSAAGASTQFRAVMSQLVDPQNVKQLKAIGVNVFDSKNHLRGWSEIIGDISKNKLLKDPKLMGKIFGREEARAGLRSLVEYVGEMDELKRAGEDTGAVQRDLNTFLASDAGKVDLAFNKMKETIAAVFTPERIKDFAAAVLKIADALVKVIDAAEAVLKKIDIGQAAGEKMGEAQLEQIAGKHLTPAQKYKLGQEKILEARKLEAEGADEVSPVEKAKRVAAEKVGRELIKQSGYVLPEEDSWSSNAYSPAAVAARERSAARAQPGGPDDQARIARLTSFGFVGTEPTAAGAASDVVKAIRDGFMSVAKLLPVPVVKIGDNQVAQSGKKATTPRTRP